MFDHLTKIVATVVPSVIATVTAAYIVTHYVNSPPAPSPDSSSAAKSVEKTVPDAEGRKRSATPVSRPTPNVRAVEERQPAKEPQAPAAKERTPSVVKEETPVVPASEPVRKAVKPRIEPHRMSAPQPTPVVEERLPSVAVDAPVAPSPDALSLARGALDRIKAEEDKSVQEQTSPVVVPSAPPREAEGDNAVRNIPEMKDESRIPSERVTEVPALPPPVIIADPVPTASLPARVEPLKRPQGRANDVFDDPPVPPADIPGNPL